MAESVKRIVVTLTAEEAKVVAARANSRHTDPGNWIAALVRQRITAPRKLTPRQNDVLEAHTAGLDDYAGALELGIPVAYFRDARTRLGLAPNPRRKDNP